MHTLTPGILQKMISKVIFGLKKMAWGSGTLCEKSMVLLMMWLLAQGCHILLFKHN